MTKTKVKVLYLPAGGTQETSKLEMQALGREIQGSLPNCEVQMGLGEVPFEEEVREVGSYFDRITFGIKNQKEREKGILRDFLTSINTTLRSIQRFKPTFVVGDGPGALIAMGLSRPEVVDLTLQSRNTQLPEIERIGPEWAGVLMIIARRPYLNKSATEEIATDIF